MLNDNSIGIELDNIGHGLNYKTFSNILMSALEKLLRLLIIFCGILILRQTER